MLSIQEQFLVLYCQIDDLLPQQPDAGQWRRSNHQPRFTAAQVIVIALMPSYFRTDTLKQTYLLVKANDSRAFPHLPSYQQWVARLHQLSRNSGGLLFYIPVKLAELDGTYLLDSLPVPMCARVGEGRVSLLRDEGGYYGKSSKGWFFGFELHVLATRSGQI